MRYDELVSPIDDSLLLEGFLDAVRQFVGNKVNQKVSVVRNAATALQVIVKICSDPKFLEPMCFLLKKAVKTKIKRMPNGRFKQAVVNRFPKGREVADFFKALCIVCIINTAEKATTYATSMAGDQAKSFVGGTALDAVAGVIVGLDTMLKTVLGAASSSNAIFTLMKSLDIGNDVLFELLTALNRKLANVPTLSQSTGTPPTASTSPALTGEPA